MNAEVLESIVATHLPAASRGDQHAYGRIVEGCQNTITSIALAIVRDVPISEDIAQEAFISAWQQLGKLNNPSSFMPWLRQITRNLSRDYLRSQKYRANPTGDIEAMMLAVADPSPGPSEFIAEQEDARIAAAVIDALPEESREVLLLYYREGQSTQQVAALLGMQNAAVRKRLSRARQSIREELLQRVGEFARSTSPTMAFTAMVTNAPGMDSQFAATAIATAVTGGSIASKGLAAGLFGALAGVAVGLFGGLAGIWGGIAHLVIKPFDAKEKRELIVYGAVNSLLMFLFTTCMFLVKGLGLWMVLSITIGMMICLMLSTMIWLPRILKRRADFDREHQMNNAAQTEPVGTWDTLTSLYSKNTPRYQLSSTGSGSMHFWMTGVPGEYIAPFDDQEKHELHKFVMVSNALFIGIVLGIGIAAYFKSLLHLDHSESLTLFVTITAGFAGAIAYCFYVWLPRILSRRHAFEKAQQPQMSAVNLEKPVSKYQSYRHIGFVTGLGLILFFLIGVSGVIALCLCLGLMHILNRNRAGTPNTTRTQHFHGFIGVLIGMTMAVIGLIVGLLSSGRL
jgi:RNA polymerase sigma factor (sigma-70 family)